MNQQDSFHILRVKLWLECSESHPSEKEWRGEIQKIETGETAYFRKLQGFAECVKKLGINEQK